MFHQVATTFVFVARARSLDLVHGTRKATFAEVSRRSGRRAAAGAHPRSRQCARDCARDCARPRTCKCTRLELRRSSPRTPRSVNGINPPYTNDIEQFAVHTFGTIPCTLAGTLPWTHSAAPARSEGMGTVPPTCAPWPLDGLALADSPPTCSRARPCLWRAMPWMRCDARGDGSDRARGCVGRPDTAVHSSGSISTCPRKDPSSSSSTPTLGGGPLNAVFRGAQRVPGIGGRKLYREPPRMRSEPDCARDSVWP